MEQIKLMKYKIIKDKNKLCGTNYIEIGSGKFAGKYWQNSSLFIHEYDFNVAEGIVAKFFKEYDCYGINNIPKETGITILSQWRKAAEAIDKTKKQKYYTLLNLSAVNNAVLTEEIFKNKEAIKKMLNELADEVEKFYKNSNWINILGL